MQNMGKKAAFGNTEEQAADSNLLQEPEEDVGHECRLGWQSRSRAQGSRHGRAAER